MLVRMGSSPRLTSRHHRIPTPPACTPSSQLCGEETESAARVSSVPTAQTVTANVRMRMNGQGVGRKHSKAGVCVLVMRIVKDTRAGVLLHWNNQWPHVCERLQSPSSDQSDLERRCDSRYHVPPSPHLHTRTQTVRRLGNCVLQSASPKKKVLPHKSSTHKTMYSAQSGESG